MTSATFFLQRHRQAHLSLCLTVKLPTYKSRYSYYSTSFQQQGFVRLYILKLVSLETIILNILALFVSSNEDEDEHHVKLQCKVFICSSFWCLIYKIKATEGEFHCTSIITIFYCFYQFHFLKNTRFLLLKTLYF